MGILPYYFLWILFLYIVCNFLYIILRFLYFAKNITNSDEKQC